jgi:serine/threonine protein kinase
MDRQPLTEEKSLKMFRQVLKSVDSLHKKTELAHLDLKPENFVLDSKNNLKLIDLSFAAPINFYNSCK